MSFIVMRAPCLMEDEGRHFVIKSYKTEDEVKDWVAAQKGQYFTPSDYYIIDSEKGKNGQ